MTIKDLVRLDPSTVRLWNGEKWTRVLGWSQTPRPDVAYEIELRSGERIGCTAGHVWPTERGNVRTDELQVGDVIKTCRLPEPENVKQPSGLDDELVGWFVGLYIAEGSRSGDAIQIASHTQELERFEKQKNVAEAYHGTCRMHKTGGNAATINLYGHVLTGILDTYVSGRTAKDKHLSVRCWQRSDGFLMAVLKGYLSGDGHYDEANDRYRIAFTNNDNWAADLRTLCARLGVSLRLKRAKHTINGREFPGYRGRIRLSVSDHHNNKPDGEIVAIRRSRARQFWDIGVEDEPHLFALASGVLTHNSKPNRCRKASPTGQQRRTSTFSCWQRPSGTSTTPMRFGSRTFAHYMRLGTRRTTVGLRRAWGISRSLTGYGGIHLAATNAASGPSLRSRSRRLTSPRSLRR